MTNEHDFYDICTFCGQLGADTRDHVPPKQLLPRPLPDFPKPIIVPAHLSCNASFRKDDEYFVSFILCERNLPVAADEPLTRFLNGIRRPQSKGFRKRLQTELIPTGIYGADGELVHRNRKEGKRIDRVLKRIVQAVARFDFDIPYIDPCSISVVHGNIDLSLFDHSRGVCGRVAYTDAFRFFCQFDLGDSLKSTWILCFYERIGFQIFVNGEEQCAS